MFSSKEQSGAVQVRAQRAVTDYARHARAIDERWADGGTPMQDLLRRYGSVRALVCGQYADVSPDVESLVEWVADELAARLWQSMGARTQAEARAYTVSSLRRQLGVGIVRAYAQFRLDRVCFVGQPRATVEAAMRAAHLGTGRGAEPVPDSFYAAFFAVQAAAARQGPLD